MTTETALVLTKPRKLTYLGVPATAFEIGHSLSSIKRFGKRVSVIRWEADADDVNGVRQAGDVSVTALTGDGRRTDVVTHARTILPQATDAAVMAWAQEALR